MDKTDLFMEGKSNCLNRSWLPGDFSSSRDEAYMNVGEDEWMVGKRSDLI